MSKNKKCDVHTHEHSHSHNECSCEHEHLDGECCSCGHHHRHISKQEFLFKLIVGGSLLAVGHGMEHWFEHNPQIPVDNPVLAVVPLILFGICYIIVGFDIVKSAVESIMNGKVFDENFLMTVASIGAFAVKNYHEACMVMLLYTIGEYFQGVAVAKSRRSITQMLQKKPTIVSVERDGKIIELPPESVNVGDIIVVNAGEKISLDGVIVEGSSDIDMRELTGESIPVSKTEGENVLSGGVNINGRLKIKVAKPYEESTIAKVLSMLQDEETKKSSEELFITKFARIYTPIVCILALVVAIVPPLFFHQDWQEWIYRGLTALVVSCPCAIVISVPLCFFGGLGACSKQGVLVKGTNYLELLETCDVGVFDKTGTVTSGKFEYVSCECKHCYCKDKKSHHELLRIIAACEKFSNHPVAKSISLAFGAFADDAVITDVVEEPGYGISAVVDGVRYYAGSEKMMQKVGVEFEETKLIGTPIYCCNDNEFLGDIVFADIIKEDSKEALAQMKKLGVKETVMLTGDKQIIADDIAKKAGIDKSYAKLLPNNKVEIVKDIQNSGKKVFYIGDGMNDAPVLKTADLGIAMGGTGSDVAIEAADVVIMGDSLTKISQAMQIARKTLFLAKENIIVAVAVKVIILAIIVFGSFVGITKVPMPLAVFGDVGICLLAILNSLRALVIKKPKHKKKK